MAWIFFLPRKSVFSAVGVTGGIVGFFFICLAPLLIHWKSTDNTVMLEQRLNLAAQRASRGKGLRRSDYSNKDSEGDDETRSAGYKLWLAFFLVTGASCLVLPVVSCFGMLSDTN